MLRTRRWGERDRPTLILLHGAGANVHWWDHLAPRLAVRFRVVALDFRGHGDSTYPEERSVGAFSADLDALLDHLGRPAAILVGHSLGAHVALAHAAGHRDTLALVAIDPARGASPSRKRATRLALTMRRTYRSREQAVARFRFLPGAASAGEALRRSIAERSIREEADGRFGFKFDPMWFGVPNGEPPALADIACPTLLLRGTESNLLTEDGAHRLAREIPGCELEEIEDAGHHVHLDQPERVVASIDAFLTRRL